MPSDWTAAQNDRFFRRLNALMYRYGTVVVDTKHEGYQSLARSRMTFVEWWRWGGDGVDDTIHILIIKTKFIFAVTPIGTNMTV